MFSVLFGLSMDYEVFLVSRIHEQWVRTGDNRGGGHHRARPRPAEWITAAASIMILVFLSFLFGQSIIIQQFGIGLARGDHHRRVRGAHRPRAGVHAPLRAFYWWLPGWLNRLLPSRHIEGEL